MKESIYCVEYFVLNVPRLFLDKLFPVTPGFKLRDLKVELKCTHWIPETPSGSEAVKRLIGEALVSGAQNGKLGV